MLLFKLDLNIEIQIAIAWKALGRYLRHAVDFLKGVLS